MAAVAPARRRAAGERVAQNLHFILYKAGLSSLKLLAIVQEFQGVARETCSGYCAKSANVPRTHQVTLRIVVMLHEPMHLFTVVTSTQSA